MSDSIGTPIAGFGRRRLVGEDLQRPEQDGPEQEDGHGPDGRRLEQPGQADEHHGRDDEVAPGQSNVHRRDGTRDRHTRSGLPATQASRSARDRVLTTCLGSTQARRAWLMPQLT